MTMTITAGGSEVGMTAGAISVNETAYEAGSFVDNLDGTYEVTYEVAEGDDVAADGQCTVSVTMSDAAGNAMAAAFTTAPAAAVTPTIDATRPTKIPVPDTPTYGLTTTFTWSNPVGRDYSDVVVSYTGTSSGDSAIVAFNATNIQITLAAGTYSFMMYGLDAAGNRSAGVACGASIPISAIRTRGISLIPGMKKPSGPASSDTPTGVGIATVFGFDPIRSISKPSALAVNLLPVGGPRYSAFIATNVARFVPLESTSKATATSAAMKSAIPQTAVPEVAIENATGLESKGTEWGANPETTRQLDGSASDGIPASFLPPSGLPAPGDAGPRGGDSDSLAASEVSLAGPAAADRTIPLLAIVSIAVAVLALSAGLALLLRAWRGKGAKNAV
ncbi:MAG: hypothetical protein A2Y36_11025 [Treponema sp. GWA1_62_8]|nr:MAG: hypothetical protein A2Y36_11025 [Treponema sp. GWA1_62_8]OHE67677.1 MAG: hypothetical protein A2001_19360 [Treponema sp. GWC1_61_84]